MNDFEKLMKSPIVDELWECEKEEFEKYVIQNEERKFNQDANALDEIVEFVENNISEDKLEEYKLKYQKVDNLITKEIEYWIKKYFRSGFYDGIRFSEEIKENIKPKETKEKCFFNFSYNQFLEYIEDIKIKQLSENKDYKELNLKIKKLKEQHPIMRNFIENEVAVENFDKNEQKALLEEIDLREQKFSIEQIEIFKLGVKEMYMYLKEMDLLK